MFKSNSFFVCGVVTQDQGQGVDKLVCLPFFLNPDADTLRRLRTVGYMLALEVLNFDDDVSHGQFTMVASLFPSKTTILRNVFVQTIGHYYCLLSHLRFPIS